MVKDILWTVFWIFIAIFFGFYIQVTQGFKPAMEFFSAYAIEKSLSVDNLFVFLIILERYRLSPKEEIRVLNYGIMGAIVLRGLFIFAGMELARQFSWLFYIFGILLIIMGIKIFNTNSHESSHEPSKSFLEKYSFSPLLLASLSLIWADIIFALDSVPAVIAITPDLFIAYTSNIFAILGLGSLMRILKKMKNELFYLKYFIALITIFVGVKLLIMNFFHIPTGVSFSIILGTLICGVMVSLFAKKPVKD